MEGSELTLNQNLIGLLRSEIFIKRFSSSYPEYNEYDEYDDEAHSIMGCVGDSPMFYARFHVIGTNLVIDRIGAISSYLPFIPPTLSDETILPSLSTLINGNSNEGRSESLTLLFLQYLKEEMLPFCESEISHLFFLIPSFCEPYLQFLSSTMEFQIVDDPPQEIIQEKPYEILYCMYEIS